MIQFWKPYFLILAGKEKEVAITSKQETVYAISTSVVAAVMTSLALNLIVCSLS